MASLAEYHAMARCYHQPTRMSEGDRAADRAWAFRRDGYEMLSPAPRDEALRVGAAILGSPTQDDGSWGYVDTRLVLGCGLFRAAVLSQAVMMRAAMWLGAPPVVMDVTAWVSRAGSPPEAAQVWHRDVDDWRAMKLFMYLTDVTPDTGPHEYIAGSARRAWFEERSLAPDPWFIGAFRGDAGLQAAASELPRAQVVGPAGTCWVENTYGLHRGAVPVTGPRVVFQALYAVSAYEGFEGAEKRKMISDAWGV